MASKRLLIIEDVHPLMQALIRMMKPHFDDIVAVDTVDDALEEIEGVDYVLADWSDPRRLDLVEFHDKVPIVVHTGGSDPVPDCFLVVPKPAKASELVAALEKMAAHLSDPEQFAQRCPSCDEESLVPIVPSHDRMRCQNLSCSYEESGRS